MACPDAAALKTSQSLKNTKRKKSAYFSFFSSQQDYQERMFCLSDKAGAVFLFLAFIIFIN